MALVASSFMPLGICLNLAYLLLRLPFRRDPFVLSTEGSIVGSGGRSGKAAAVDGCCSMAAGGGRSGKAAAVDGYCSMAAGGRRAGKAAAVDGYCSMAAGGGERMLIGRGIGILL
ncbi:hypothetical protein CEUSTIGMA_g13294.t1 [Chlamydomonas eustigma]|uniref:Uncharacterized protein n=1 Tax=Chlamydomonas eustigma TaxID=1157962 RepID=A0A250XS38_9CHLO|nr:hypothetical protein CEUSTIGMA_g13294.t1 [Chlamydomonas eustigma]|eukprot:GAX85878.1 hypothetical protein CEUSTIGMA_g13294.t1 [Chlamydomonas eustigma]